LLEPFLTCDPERIARVLTLVEAAETRGEKWEGGLQLAMQVVLVSPKFLFRVELDDRSQGAEALPLDEYQLASRLSYFLWSTMPDEELLNLAGKKGRKMGRAPMICLLSVRRFVCVSSFRLFPFQRHARIHSLTASCAVSG
jgi:Protein of unknown function (DUF1595)/Protein of unknown function (DUF1592)